MGRYDTVINTTVGVLAAVVLSFIPFSTVFGAAIAGFLEGPDSRDGLLVGSLVGLVAFIPFGFLGLFALFFVGFASISTGTGAVGGAFAFATFLGIFGLLLLLYTVVPAIAGGVIGSLLAREYPDRHARARDLLGMEPIVGTVDDREGQPLERYESSQRTDHELEIEDGADDR